MALTIGWEEKPTAAGRRSAFEVRMDILKVVAIGSAKPTHIMYRSNTSWMILQKNLVGLLAAGFVRETGEHKVEYAITDSGSKVLGDYLDIVNKTSTEPLEVEA